jgi:hypothetical protein
MTITELIERRMAIGCMLMHLHLLVLTAEDMWWANPKHVASIRENITALEKEYEKIKAFHIGGSE